MTVTRVLAGLALLAAATSAAIIVAQEHRLSTWRPVPAVVIESSERTYRTYKGGSSRSVRIRYLYRADGREYESTRVYPGPLAATGGDSAELRMRFYVGAAATAFVNPDDPSQAFLVPLRSFLPYLIGLLVAAPLGALAAGLATGGIRYVRSSERETPAPVEDRRGWFVVRPFRPYRALRNAAAAALAVFAPVGAIAFVDYFGRPGPKGATAVFALLAWLALLARLAWAVVKRTWVGGRLDDARLAIRPSHPVAGTPLHVVFDQPVRTDLWVRAVDLTLVVERLTVGLVNRKARTKKVEIARKRLRLPVDARAWPSSPIHVEGTLEVPAEGTEEGGFLSWRIEARTRMNGPDYVTRFPIGGPDTDS
jgi:uncharacterized protein DUF3592